MNIKFNNDSCTHQLEINAILRNAGASLANIISIEGAGRHVGTLCLYKTIFIPFTFVVASGHPSNTYLYEQYIVLGFFFLKHEVKSA